MVSETIVKTSKNVNQEHTPTKKLGVNSIKQNKISVCDIMKINTSKIIKKIESQVPSYVQQYSDLYTEYLHMFDDLFGTCYISEKEFFDKLDLDQKTLKAFEDYFGNIAEDTTKQIEMSNIFLRAYIKMRITAIQAFNQYIHVMMDSYAKMLSQYNIDSEK